MPRSEVEASAVRVPEERIATPARLGDLDWCGRPQSECEDLARTLGASEIGDRFSIWGPGRRGFLDRLGGEGPEAVERHVGFSLREQPDGKRENEGEGC